MKTSKDAANKPAGAKAPLNNKSVSASRSGTSQNARPTSAATSRPGATAAVAQKGAKPVAKKSGFKMRPVDAIITGVAVLVVALIVWAVWSTANDSSSGSPSSTLLPAGTQAPDFSLPGNDGKTHSLADFKGKPLFLEFMAPWCPHCQEDSTIFNQVYDNYQAKGLSMLGISATPYGKDYSSSSKPPIQMEDMIWFGKTFGVKYPLLYDKDVATRVKYNIDYFPTLYLIDKDGKVASTMLAEENQPITYDRVATALDKIVK